MLAACGSGANAPTLSPESRTFLEDGRARWAERKPQCARYHYDRAVGINSPGGGLLTVQIVDDQPQWRWYLGFNLGPPDAAEVSWFEDAGALGTHPSAPSANTVEQLWDECEAI